MQEKKKTPTQKALEAEKSDQKQGIKRPQGYYSNMALIIRNRGVQHRFQNDIGGCSANYR